MGTSIWDWRERTPNIEPSSREGYEAYRATPEGEALYVAFVTLALRLRRQGFDHYTAQGIIETIRMRLALREGPRSNGVKVNNNFAAYLAREAMAMESELRHFFEVRRSKADL